MEQHVLIIPPTGLMEVVHTDKEVDPGAVLRARGNKGDLLSLNLGELTGRVEWIVPRKFEDFAPLNERAQEAVVMLCGVHMVFPGHVIFLDVHPDRVYEIVARLSRKE